MDWTLATAKPGQQAKAIDNCQRQDMRVVAPRLRQTVVRRGRLVQLVQFLFPSYIIVELTGPQLYGQLRSTIGVSRALMLAGVPAVVPEHVVQGLQARMDGEGFVELPAPAPPPPPTYTAGQRVQVTSREHTLFGHRGMCMGMTAQHRVRVLMSMLGRKVVVEFSDYSALQVAA